MMSNASRWVWAGEGSDSGSRSFGAEGIKLSRAWPITRRKVRMERKGVKALLEEIIAGEHSLPCNSHVQEGFRQDVSVLDHIDLAGHVIDEHATGTIGRMEKEIDPGARCRLTARRNLNHVFQHNREFHRL